MPAQAALARYRGRGVRHAAVVESDGSSTESDDPLPRDKGAVEEEGDVVVRGRARRHFIAPTLSGLQVDETRRKIIADKGWARRSVVRAHS